jgi:DNA polymerase-3 subunit delta'
MQAQAGSHPDIDVVRKPDERSTIPIDLLIGDTAHRMREGLCWRILLRPSVGERKVAVIMDADHLDEAANCLLKTLEEPPLGAVIILVGTSIERQLPTIRSRCQVIRFAPLPAEKVRLVLERESHAADSPVDAATLDACSRAAGGSLSRARLLLDPEITAFRGRLLELLSRHPLHGVDLARELIAFVDAAGKEAPPRRARLRIVLESALEVFRAAATGAVGRATGDPALARAAQAWTANLDAALAAVDGTLDALGYVDRNAHISVVIDAWTAILEEPRLARLS